MNDEKQKRHFGWNFVKIGAIFVFRPTLFFSFPSFLLKFVAVEEFLYSHILSSAVADSLKTYYRFPRFEPNWILPNSSIRGS